MVDKHVLIADIDEGTLMYRVVCPYDLADTERPCWPVDTEQDDYPKLPAPQECNYTEWVENLAVEEIGVGRWEVVLPIHHVEWDDGGPTFEVGDPYAYHEPTNQLPEGEASAEDADSE